MMLLDFSKAFGEANHSYLSAVHQHHYLESAADRY